MRPFALTFLTAISFSLSAYAIQPTIDAPTIDLTPTKATVESVPDESGPVVREGTRFISRTGHLTRVTEGHRMVLTFDDGIKTRPMTVLANLNLFSMESVLSMKGKPVQFIVSGTVCEFKGHNYILLDKVTTTSETPKAITPGATSTAAKVAAKPIETTTQVAESKATTAIVPGTTQEQTMARLLAPAPSAGEALPPPASNEGPTIDRSTGTAAVAPTAPALTVIREGTHLINRVGRLSHSPDGHQAILTFDADGKAMKDPPMVILPNLKLESMEQEVLNHAGDVHFRVSGTVTEYKGRNYIQMDKAVVMADVEAQF